MGYNEGEGAHGKNDKHFFAIVRYGAGTLMRDCGNEFLVCSLVALAARLELVLAEDWGGWITLRFYVMSIMTASTDRRPSMSQVKFPAVEALIEAVHDVFFKFVFFYDFLSAVALAAGFHLILTAYGRFAVFNLCDVMRGAVAIKTESTIRLFLFDDILSMHT